ncbi:subtilisin-like serine protease [Apiospora arundinis]
MISATNYLVAVVALGTLGFAANAPPTQPLPLDDSIVKGSYIAELESGGDIQGFLDQVQGKLEANVSRRLDLDYSLFKGVSFHVEGSHNLLGDSNHAGTRSMITALPRVKKVWPVRRVGPPQVRVAWTGKDKSFRANRGDTASKQDPYAPHVMTQVDKMHERGFTGNGTRIGVVDTGIDYTHPALGGCFGPGCLVSYGRDLQDGDDDPMDNCVGHGTHVAGIIAAQTNALGFVGAAPGVTLGAYRIFPCGNDGTTSDIVIAGFNQAFEDGSDIITASLGSFSGWAEDPVSVAVSRIVDAGVPCTVAVGNQVGGSEGMFGDSAPASGRGVLAITSFENTVVPTYDDAAGTLVMAPNTRDPGFTNEWASWRPNFGLELKPEFGAPGGDILSTYPVSMGSYAVLSGTSMATPLAAAVVALVSQARGGILHDNALLTRLLVSTAKPNLISASPLRDPDPSWVPQDLTLAGPAIQQGGGLVQALDAAFATILVSESSMSFNDSEHFVPEHRFTVTNSGLKGISLNLTHLPAFTTSALYQIYRSSTPVPSESHAALTISPSTLSLDPGASAKIRVTAVPPKDLDSTILPVYSGYVVLSANDGTRLSVPYLGAATAMRNQTVMASERMWLTRSDSPRSDPVTANATFQMALPVGAPKEWLVNATNATTTPEGYNIYVPGTQPSQYTWLVLGSSLLRIELVRLDKVVSGDGLVGRTITGFPMDYNRALGLNSIVNGTLADGSYLEPGQYKSVVLALRIFGDPQNIKDYDRFDSAPFWIRYVSAAM